MNVLDKVIVVTGAASGIGRAMAERFAAEAAKKVVTADIDGDGARRVAERIGGWGLAVDVRKEEDMHALIQQTEERFGPIDLFCSNAGIAVGEGVDAPNDLWQTIWEVNTMSHVYAARHLVPRMEARGGGYLLITASAAGLLSQIGSAPYTVTKHAAVGLAEWIAITHGRDGIKVSALCPQAVQTPLIEASTELAEIAGVDGIIAPEAVAESVIQGLADERFLILPHPTVTEYIQRKAADYDRWLKGMQRLQEQFVGPRNF
jgi:NAD(P)-dependent dehydrogenase (short-subunit alcohol dehydrogenase family)